MQRLHSISKICVEKTYTFLPNLQSKDGSKNKQTKRTRGVWAGHCLSDDVKHLSLLAHDVR